jgi:1,2-phenylacetyl-CoA epoxidase catalytic subunit
MRFSIDGLDDAARTAFENDLFAIADSKFVLGNWYARCILNGRSLPDFAALTAMTGAAYGHTRSLWQYLVNFGHTYSWIERGRGADGIRSMNMLDTPPNGWPDFIATTWLAEQATWMAVSGYLNCPDRALAGLAEKIGEEAYFHLKYAEGWMEIMSDSAADTKAFAAALERRLPVALGWFGSGKDDSVLKKAGLRDIPTTKMRKAFAAEIGKGSSWIGKGVDLPQSAPLPDGWIAAHRRAGPLPSGLFDAVRFRDPEAAH